MRRHGGRENDEGEGGDGRKVHWLVFGINRVGKFGTPRMLTSLIIKIYIINLISRLPVEKITY